MSHIGVRWLKIRLMFLFVNYSDESSFILRQDIKFAYKFILYKIESKHGPSLHKNISKKVGNKQFDRLNARINFCTILAKSI